MVCGTSTILLSNNFHFGTFPLFRKKFYINLMYIYLHSGMFQCGTFALDVYQSPTTQLCVEYPTIHLYLNSNGLW